MKCNWCGYKGKAKDMIKWEGNYFCSNKCLDECRAIQ